MKDRMMDNVQNCDSYINMPSPQTYGSNSLSVCDHCLFIIQMSYWGLSIFLGIFKLRKVSESGSALVITYEDARPS
jgi:hypothetical protein